jgi:hypothetical protein
MNSKGMIKGTICLLAVILVLATGNVWAVGTHSATEPTWYYQGLVASDVVKMKHVTVVYDPLGLAGVSGNPKFMMWWGTDSPNKLYAQTSIDGLTWTALGQLSVTFPSTIVPVYHPEVIYDRQGFVLKKSPGTVYFKMWFYDAGVENYNWIRYAESGDGINWQIYEDSPHVPSGGKNYLEFSGGSGNEMSVLFKRGGTGIIVNSTDQEYVGYQATNNPVGISTDGAWFFRVDGQGGGPTDVCREMIIAGSPDVVSYRAWDDFPAAGDVTSWDSNTGLSWNTPQAGNAPISGASWSDFYGAMSVVLVGNKYYMFDTRSSDNYKVGLLIAPLVPPTEVWVDDDWTGPGSCGGHLWGYDAFKQIQDGVNGVASGGTVNVAAGQYNESVTINKSVTLTGDRGDPGVAGPGASAPIMDGTGFSGFPAFKLSAGVNDVIIEGFEIRNYGPNGNTNADGVSVWNPSNNNVIVRDNYMHDLGYSGVLTGNGWGGAQGLHDNWQVTYNIVQSTGAYGFDMENVKNSVINHNVISGIPSYTINVIALATEAGANITCENVDIKYNTITGCTDRNINLFAWTDGGADRTATVKNVTVSNNTISGIFNLILAWKTGPGTNTIRDLTINDNILTVDNPKGAGYMVDLADVVGTSSFSGNTITLTGTIGGGGTFFHGVNVGGGSTGMWSIANNHLDGNNVGVNSVGIRLRSTLPSSVVLNMTGNTVTEFANGILSDALASGADINLNNNSIAGNAVMGISNGAGAMIDASSNWYGTNTPVGVAAAVSTNVDYTPWLDVGTDMSGDPGFQPDLSYLHVDDASPQTGTIGRIQEGVNLVTGSTVQVEAGTYDEQVYITKSLDLIGIGSKPVIEAPPAATRTTYNIPESGRTFDPIIFADGGAGVIDVTVDNFEIDGNNDGGSNTFCGILFRNTDPGTISNNDLHSLRGTGQETQGILMYGANTDVTVSGNTVTDFSRNGITANVNASADISGNTIAGDGPLPLGNWAQNGIQIGFGASGSITGNTVTGCSILDPDWAASGILSLQSTGTIRINGNTAIENQVNIYLGDCSASIQGNTINATATGTGQTYFYGIVGDPGETKAPKPSPFGELDDVSKSIGARDHLSGTKVTYTVTCTDNMVESDGSAGGTGIGIYAGMYGTYDIDFTATGNTVRYWQWGFELYEYSPNNLISAEIHYNNIEGNTDYGIYNYLTKTFDATNNWWGSTDGPEDAIGTDEAQFNQCYDVSTIKNTVAEITGTLGNAVSEYVKYCPWLGGNAGFDAEIYAGCHDPCDDFCLDFKLSGSNIRFFHFEYPLPTCIDLVSSSGTHPNLATFYTTMFGNVLHIDGSFDPNFTGTNVKIGEVCFTHDGSCPNTVQTLTCTYDEVRDGNGTLVDVTPGLAIINVDNDTPDKDHPTGDILPCYNAPDDLDWACWNLTFYKGTEDWQCHLIQASIRIYNAAGCNSSDLIFTHDFFTAPIPGDFTICYPTNQAERNAIWTAIYGTSTPPFNPTYDGTYYVRITAKDSCCNEADNCDAFTFCTDTYTENCMTCVDAKPAHNHICLEWNYNSHPANAVKLRILRSPYRAGNYPEYAAGNPVPSGYNDPTWYMVYEGTDTYPCTGATWFQDDGQVCNGSGTYFANNTRDIYWYAGFTQDAAGNWSSPNMTVGTGADRATSYWLGDVADIPGIGGPDGYVYGFTGDLGRLTSAYGTTPPSDNTVDYGPETQENGIGRGIPVPDDIINWKDLLPFSFNYNIVGPSGSCTTWPLLATNQPPRQLNKTAQPVSVWLEQVAGTQHDGVTFALRMTNPGDAIHLFHTEISFDASALSLKQVRRGEVGITEGSTEFFAHPITGEGLVDVDLAALGPDAYVVGSGAVAYLDFSYKATEMPTKIELKEAILYDGEGNQIDLSPTGVEIETQTEALPTQFALYHNQPNPFNPMTTIKYDLPQASYVKLVVYNVMGQKVTTLVDGMVEAGRHQVIWDAKDVSSGVYFYRINTGNFTQMHKMILLK